MDAEDEISTQQSKLWNRALQYIGTKLSKPAFETWFSSTSAYGEEHSLTIISEETLKSEWLELRYSKLIREAVTELTGTQEIELRFITKS